MESRTVFLMYHELEIAGRSFCHSEPGYVRYVISASDFRAQMELLRNSGWQGLSVSEALKFSLSPTVAITFDDGCETDLLIAVPILREQGFGATFYVTVGFLGRPGYLTAAQLREITNSGFEIGCHSLSHSYITDLDQAGLNREIVEARHELEQILGEPVKHFSCPGGRYNQRILNTARLAGYCTVATSRACANSTSTNQFALGRVAVMRGTDLQKFEALCCGRGLWQLRIRDAFRQTAKRLLGNSTYDHVRSLILRRVGPR